MKTCLDCANHRTFIVKEGAFGSPIIPYMTAVRCSCNHDIGEGVLPEGNPTAEKCRDFERIPTPGKPRKPRKAKKG